MAKDSVEVEERAQAWCAAGSDDHDSDDAPLSAEAALARTVDEQQRALDAQKGYLNVAASTAARRRGEAKVAATVLAAAIKERKEVETRVATAEARAAKLRGDLNSLLAQARSAQQQAGDTQDMASQKPPVSAASANDTGLEHGNLDEQAEGVRALVRARQADHNRSRVQYASLARNTDHI